MKLCAEDSVVSVLSVTGITHQSFTAAFVCFMQTKSLETKDFNELLVEKSQFLCAIYLWGAASSLLPSSGGVYGHGAPWSSPRHTLVQDNSSCFRYIGHGHVRPRRPRWRQLMCLQKPPFITLSISLPAASSQCLCSNTCKSSTATTTFIMSYIAPTHYTVDHIVSIL